MKILLTGHLGYLGQTVGTLLHAGGHEVAGVDTGLFEREHSAFAHDIRDIRGCDVAGFDAVVHLAAVCNDACGELSASATHAINHDATVRLATLARDVGVRRFVLASSCSVYGNSPNDEVDESCAIIPLTAYYAASKFKAERALCGLATDGFWPVALRFATLFGPSASFRSDILLNRMVGTAVRCGVIRVSNFAVQRPLLHVVDAAHAITQVLAAPPQLLRVGVFNVGDTNLNHRLDEVADVVRQAVPSAEIRYQPAADHRSYTVRFDRYREAFPGWSPQHTIEGGTEELVRYYRSDTTDSRLPADDTAALLLDPHRAPLPLTPPEAGTQPETLYAYDQALAWYEAEHSVLLNTLAQASAHALDTHTWQLAWTLTDYLDRCGHWHDQATVQTLALAAAQRSADPLGRAWSHRNLAHAHTRLGRYDDAFQHFQAAVGQFSALGASSLQASVRLNYAWAYELTGQHDQALYQAQAARDLYTSLEDEVGHARSLNAVGWYQTLSGDHEQALINCEEALTLLRRLGVRHDEAYTLESIAHAHRGLGQLAQATDNYNEALNLFRQLGDRYYEAAIHIRLGELEESSGQTMQARGHWVQALDILDSLRHREAEDLRARLERL
ncbi:NAD-dependent epimerase/dehydratase family protein [Streptomyces sp. NPDC002755]|uniref:NAD-dependent epimerase/dehydratase family protein n=1 Tax=Streptomyces sp. NPDC002884 TaxID=3154544 RepID=UPI00331F58D7